MYLLNNTEVLKGFELFKWIQNKVVYGINMNTKSLDLIDMAKVFKLKFGIKGLVKVVSQIMTVGQIQSVLICQNIIIILY